MGLIFFAMSIAAAIVVWRWARNLSQAKKSKVMRSLIRACVWGVPLTPVTGGSGDAIAAVPAWWALIYCSVRSSRECGDGSLLGSLVSITIVCGILFLVSLFFEYGTYN